MPLEPIEVQATPSSNTSDIRYRSAGLYMHRHVLVLGSCDEETRLHRSNRDAADPRSMARSNRGHSAANEPACCRGDTISSTKQEIHYRIIGLHSR
jgi:hypothetical protein